jgi:hypothetical protein
MFMLRPPSIPSLSEYQTALLATRQSLGRLETLLPAMASGEFSENDFQNAYLGITATLRKMLGNGFSPYLAGVWETLTLIDGQMESSHVLLIA